MRAKVIRHPIRVLHRISPVAFRLLLACASLVIYGCARDPTIYAISPDLCTRHEVSVGDLVVTYRVGSTQLTIYDYTIRSGKIYYRGIEGPDIVKFHSSPDGTKNVYYVPLDDVNNDYYSDGIQTTPAKGPLAPDSNKIGVDGEAYIRRDQFYLVIYSASPSHLNYALQGSRSTPFGFSWEPVPCPEP